MGDTITCIKWQNITFQMISCPFNNRECEMIIIVHFNGLSITMPNACHATDIGRDVMISVELVFIIAFIGLVDVSHIYNIKLLQWFTEPRAQPTEFHKRKMRNKRKRKQVHIKIDRIVESFPVFAVNLLCKRKTQHNNVFEKKTTV